MTKPKKKTIICWFCGNKMRGGSSPVLLTVDGYSRKLHKACVKEVKADSDFKVISDEEVIAIGGFDNEFDY